MKRNKPVGNGFKTGQGNMKKILIIAGILISGLSGMAQRTTATARFTPGEGLDISLNRGEHHLNLGGFIRTYGGYEYNKEGENETLFGIRHAFLTLNGDFMFRTFSFQMQADLADSIILTDAWAAWHLKEIVKIAFGQKQTLTNNREMIFEESAISMESRSLLSKTFATTGRELGFFIESSFSLGNVILRPSIAITTGKGRSTFTTDSLGKSVEKLKFGGRLDLMPFGDFSPGNKAGSVDFKHEERLKLLLGGAFSINNRTTHNVGDGTGEFQFYNKEGEFAFPAYRKISGDILMKWKGFSLLGEFINATAANLSKLYRNDNGLSQLTSEEISQYLALGNGFNVQIGYFRNGWALDARYSKLISEFSDVADSFLKETDEYGFSFTRYFAENRFMCQLSAAYRNYPAADPRNERINAQISIQVKF